MGHEGGGVFRLMADALPQIIWTNDGHGIANYFNQRWYDYTGLTFEQSVGGGWQTVVHPDDAWTQDAWRHAQEAGQEFDVQYRLRSGSREYRWFIGRNVPLRDANGAIVGWFGSATDVHDLKRAEEALRDSQEHLRLAQEAGGVGIWDWHITTGESYWSEILWALFGYDPSAAPSPHAAWRKHLIPEDRVRVDKQIAQLLRSEENVFRTEFRIQRNDGSVRWLASAGRVTRESSGRPVRMMGVNFDVTSQKEWETALATSEQRLRLVVENAREYAIFSLDLDRVVTTWNSGAEAILGYTSVEAIGRLGDIIFTPEDREAGAPQEEAQRARLEGRAADERWHLRKDGSRFWGSGVMMAMHDPQGHAIGFVKVFRDETAELRAKEALEKSRAQLWTALLEADRLRAQAEAATQAKDHFLAVLSHELRTPLTPVMMATHTLLRRKDLTDQTRDALEMISRNVQLEARFVDDLLDVTKIARGKMELARAPVDMHEVVKHAVEVSQADIEAKAQQLTVALEASRCLLHGDRSRLQQVIWNLLKNASKFTPPGGRIKICTRDQGDYFLAEVSDTGIGIAREALLKIFDPFTQADRNITREYGGLGLGLAIAQASVRAHGGELYATSEGKGFGAKFTMSIPYPSERTRDA